MKKVSFIGNVRYLGVILIAMQGILLALLAIFMLNSSYQNQWNKYLETDYALDVHLQNISEDYKDNIEEFLHNEALEKNLFISRKDSTLNDEGARLAYTFGIYGDVENNDVSLEFYGKRIIEKDMLNKLILSEMDESTLGIDKGSVYSIGEIPSFRFGQKTIFKKLNRLIKESGTINGDYVVLGLNDSDKNAFIQGLALACNVPADNLLKEMKGSSSDDSFAKIIILVFIFAQVILNAVYFMIITIRNISKSGKLALLGWSRAAYCAETLGIFIGYAMLNIPIQIVIGILLSGWSKMTGLFISYFILFAVVNVIVVTLEIAISAIIQLSISPMNAIKGRIPKNILYIFGILAYIGVSAGIVFCGAYVDGPMKIISENARLSQSWNSVSEFQILRSISVGNDQSSITGNSKGLDQSLYDWYKGMYDDNGVYLIKTEYYDNKQLDGWKQNNVYENIPESPFWCFSYSPNYIKSLNLNVDSSIINEAKSGTRVYMIPESYSENEKVKLKNWLTESSTKRPHEGDISTVFNKEKNVKFIEYTPKDNMFTWNTESTYENTCTNPVIYICTPENMTYFESESIRANGFNGYIKFVNKAVAEKYLDKDILEKYKLNDNNLEFTNVGNYIDGLQKGLMTTIAWFGVVFLILMLILLGILIALATVFRIANQEKINVKKFLGYGFINLYRIPIIMLVSVICIELIIMLIIGSKFGFLLMLILAVTQILIFSRYMTKCEIENILMAFKGE
ncbi:Uncharacterized protein conserved in bacteria [Clostridium putrefaciens]|uniref:Uncharacterized protein conserved in bacteria n=1 Tax=Clostridium putrefaciens TaxID=99675 RepID=A0A381JB77_9CLOT|nr:hypothetical protein [Clostridium putrefaciens]SUY48461.1 Uncharacterized protein conserved in bacteria [Clostridium putrefaciens]